MDAAGDSADDGPRRPGGRGSRTGGDGGALARLLREALAAKGREIGRRYSNHDLQRDSSVHHSYASQVLHGQRRPSPQVIGDWARALSPHLSLQDALLAAGHAPTDPAALARVRGEPEGTAGHQHPDLLTRLARLVDSAVAEGIPAQEGAHAGDGGDAEPIAYLPPRLLGSRHVSLIVRGDCMAPDVQAGELVIAHLDGQPRDGDLVIAEIDGQPQVRLYDARRSALWTRDNTPPTPLHLAGAIIPILAVQRPSRPRPRRRPGAGRRSDPQPE